MENDRRSVALQLFHKLRISAQVRDRIAIRYQEFNREIQSISTALCQFAAWKNQTILYREGVLWVVHECQLETVGPLDMSPKFTYGMGCISGKTRQGHLLMCSSIRVTLLESKDQGHYRVATKADIEAVSAKLEIITKNMKQYAIVEV